MRISLAIRYLRRIFVLLILITLSNRQLIGQGKFSFELLPGGAITLPSKLTIVQEGYPDIRFIANYRTENFILPIYYSMRISRQMGNAWGLEFELNHLKIILDNKPSGIERFSVTHGYNQFWVNAAKTYKGFTLRTGIGAVVGHPENEVRGKILDQTKGLFQRGYYLCGITTQIAIQKKIYLGRYFFISGEAKINGAYANIPVVGGYARTPVYAVHGILGAGISF